MDIISVVIPVKNEALYLKECLDTILIQSSPIHRLQIIVVNDHSTDATEDILLQYSQSHEAFEYYNNPGQGVIDALAFAEKKSIGNFITRMDGDDLMPPGKLSSFHALLTGESPPEVVTGKVAYFHENQLGEGFLKYENWLNSLGADRYAQIFRECTIASANWMMTKETLTSIGGFTSSMYPEDYDLVFRMRNHQLKIGFVNEVTHLWRDHPNRASRNDPNYLDHTFIPLKMKHFIQSFLGFKGDLFLIGAGKKGKRVALRLKESDVDFDWRTNNPNKIGHVIYDVKLQDIESMPLHEDCRYIVTVGNAIEKNKISDLFSDIGLKEGQHFFHFS